MADDNSNAGQKQSKYNAAADINFWIQTLYKKAELASVRPDFNTWNSFLNAVWMNLAADADPNDKTKITGINKNLEEVGFRKLLNNRSNFDQKPQDYETLRDNVYSALMNKHIFLREVQNKQGKGVAYVDEMEDEFE